MKVRRISTLSILELFDYLYNSGVDYVDIDGEQGKDSDILHVTFTEDYIDPEYVDDFKEDQSQPQPIEIKGKLTDSDIKDLL